VTTVAIADQRVRRIRELAIEHLELEPEELTMTSDFVADCGADSLSVIDFLGALEREFTIVIDESSLDQMRTLQTTFEVVAEVAGW
jgi:acyl carrier protein